MQKFVGLLFLSVVLMSFQETDSTQTSELRTVKNEAFKPGEKLTFRLHYGLISAGEATMEVLPQTKTFGGRTCYQVVGSGQSVGAFNWFFKVNDRYESTIDSQAIFPWYFVRSVSEGGYKINQHVMLNQYKDSAISEKKAIYIPKNTQDIISAFYYARTIDFSNAKEGDIFPIQGYIDDALFPLNIKYVGREMIKSKKGKFQCIKFHPLLLKGRVFKENEDMTVWISDDKNHIPVRVQSDIFVGSIKMDLEDFENLANEPALIKN